LLLCGLRLFFLLLPELESFGPLLLNSFFDLVMGNTLVFEFFSKFEQPIFQLSLSLVFLQLLVGRQARTGRHDGATAGTLVAAAAVTVLQMAAPMCLDVGPGRLHVPRSGRATDRSQSHTVVHDLQMVMMINMH
jgi:hypothetical protein